MFLIPVQIHISIGLTCPLLKHLLQLLWQCRHAAQLVHAFLDKALHPWLFWKIILLLLLLWVSACLPAFSAPTILCLHVCAVCEKVLCTYQLCGVRFLLPPSCGFWKCKRPGLCSTPKLSHLTGPHLWFLKDNSLHEEFCTGHFFSFSSCLRMLLRVLSLHYLVEKSLLLLISFSLYRDVFSLRPLLIFFFLSLALRRLMIPWFDNYFLHVHFSFLHLWVFTFPQIWVEYFSVSKVFLSFGRH